MLYTPVHTGMLENVFIHLVDEKHNTSVTLAGLHLVY